MYTTRIAPSPTGALHIGNCRTAYFNWLVAKISGGQFILRIDDTDAARSKNEYVDIILDTMMWLGLDYDKIVFQSSRYDRYCELAQQWIDLKWAYIEDGAVKFRLPFTYGEGPQSWHDEIGGDIKITEDDYKRMNGAVMIRADKTPTYNWASVIDDMDFGVNYIIRGVDHITNTAKQVVFWNLLNSLSSSGTIKVCPNDYNPKFAHVGLIGEKGKPLSKSEGAASVLYYREKGYDADAFLNFLARLGWGPKVDDKSTSILTKENMLNLFLTGGSMKSSIANIDLNKLEAFDRKYKAKKGIWRNKDTLI